MDISLSNLKIYANKVPFGSATELMVKGCKCVGFCKAEDLTLKMLTNGDDASIDAMIRLVARFIIARFVFPRVIDVFYIYHFAVGAVYIGIAFITHFRNEVKNDSLRAEMHRDFQVGFMYVLTAAYDFALGYFTKKTYPGIVISAAFALMPQTFGALHRKIFAAPSTPKGKERVYLNENCKIWELANRFADGLIPFKKTVNPQEAPEAPSATSFVNREKIESSTPVRPVRPRQRGYKVSRYSQPVKKTENSLNTLITPIIIDCMQKLLAGPLNTLTANRSGGEQTPPSPKKRKASRPLTPPGENSVQIV